MIANASRKLVYEFEGSLQNRCSSFGEKWRRRNGGLPFLFAWSHSSLVQKFQNPPNKNASCAG